MEQNTVAISTEEYTNLKEMVNETIGIAIQNTRLKNYILKATLSEWNIEKEPLEKLTDPKRYEFGYTRENMIDLLELGITLDEMQRAIRQAKMEYEESVREEQ